jgi:C-methyltransferase C-terminal domain
MIPSGPALVTAEQVRSGMEVFRPLGAFVCFDCRLVQLVRGDDAEVATSHVARPSGAGPRAEAEAARLIRLLGLGPETPVAEIGRGDAAGLRPFARAGLPVLGLEACAEPARGAAATREGIPAEVARFGAATARQLRATGPAPALILAGRDVLPDAADLHDVLSGLRTLLAPGGIVVLELQHLLHLVRHGAFDALGHRHGCTPSLLVAELTLGQHGLVVFDAEELSAPPGTLRLHLRHAEDTAKPVGVAVGRLRAAERAAGLEGPEPYARFAEHVVEAKCAILDFLAGARRAGRRVAGAGAEARAATMLNYCGIGPELLPFTVDARARAEAGLMVAGRRIPVLAPEAILEDRPDFVLVLDGDRRDETMEEFSAIRDWGGRFVVPLPNLQVL